MELEILISSLVAQVHKLYNEVYFKSIDKYLSDHGKICALQLQIDTYVKELKALTK